MKFGTRVQKNMYDMSMKSNLIFAFKKNTKIRFVTKIPFNANKTIMPHQLTRECYLI